MPVHSGEIQCAGLGMDICAFDDESNSAVVGARGELVCSTPFPSMPVGFLNDAVRWAICSKDNKDSQYLEVVLIHWYYL